MKSTLLKEDAFIKSAFKSDHKIKEGEATGSITHHSELRIIGKNAMQNELLVSFLRKKTGLNCIHYLNLDLPLIETLEENQSVLYLLDSNFVDFNELWTKLSNSLTSRRSSQLIFTIYNVDPDTNIVEEAIDHGIRGIFFNTEPLDIIPKGIVKIIEGEMWYPRKVLSQYIKEAASTKHKVIPNEIKVNLTKREREILLKIFTGQSNQEIAEELCLSYHTVKTHIYNIYRKIGAPDRFQATLWAAKYL